MVNGDITTLQFNEFGENLGTRQLGKITYDKLISLMGSYQKIILDFSGVNVVSNSFADECLAKLLLIMTLDEIKQRTTFKNVNDLAKTTIAAAFKRRLISAVESH